MTISSAMASVARNAGMSLRELLDGEPMEPGRWMLEYDHLGIPNGTIEVVMGSQEEAKAITRGSHGGSPGDWRGTCNT